jgi:hypothetical protein
MCVSCEVGEGRPFVQWTNAAARTTRREAGLDAAPWTACSCRRRKRGTANAQRYEQRLLDHLVDTTQALQNRTYAPSRSLCFVARQPKAREIHAADFSDRVVHHVLVPRLEALFEPIFIRRAFHPALPLVQLGNRVALFEPDLAVALAAAPWLALWRAARAEARAGLGPGLSWPLSHLKGLGRSLREGGEAYASIAEEGYLAGGMKRRVLRYLYLPGAGWTV